ncbi:MAG: DUF3467 domain-containing protein [Deltaproteobacteria bacterium]|nr:DUF3467 domain-containing protein [Deltaproteobacteria bacterium]
MDDDQKNGDGAGGPTRADGGAQQARVNLQIQAEEAAARGIYSNSALVNLNENEITLDFLYIPPQSPVAHLRSRVILSPRQAKQLVRVLGESMARYERRFGTLGEPRKKDPFLH